MRTSLKRIVTLFICICVILTTLISPWSSLRSLAMANLKVYEYDNSSLSTMNVATDTENSALENSEDYQNLVQMVTDLNNQGGTFPTEWDNSEYYGWDDNGNLVSICWSCNYVDKLPYCLNVENATLDFSQFTEIRDIVCWNVRCSNIDISGCEKLSRLNCSENGLNSLDVSANTALTYLNCFANNLNSLDVSANTTLFELCCNANILSSLDVSGATALTILDCSENKLCSLDLSSNTALNWLYCYENQLSSLDVSKNTALISISGSHNNLSDLDLSGATALTFLHCSYNNLSSLDVSKNTTLTTIDCMGNNLSSLDVSKNTKLEILACEKDVTIIGWNNGSEDNPTTPPTTSPTSDFKFDSITYTYGSKNVNILTTSHTVEKSHKPFTIKCKANSNATGITYYIDAGKRYIKSDTGVFENVDPSEFTVTDQVRVIAKEPNGKAYEVKTNLRIKEDNILKSTSLKLGDDTSIKLGDDVPLIGGSTMKFLVPKVPVSVVVEDGKVRVGINIKEDKLYSFSSDKNATTDKKKKTFKQEWEELKKDIKKTKIINKKYKEYLKVCKLQGGLPGIQRDVDYTIVGYAEGNWSSDSQFEDITGEIILTVTGKATGRKQLLVWSIPVTLKVTGSISGTLDAKITYDFIHSQWKGDMDLIVSPSLELFAGVGVSDWLSAGVYGNVKANVYATLLSSTKPLGLDKCTLQGKAGLKGYVAKREIGDIVLLNSKEYLVWERKQKTTSKTAVLGDDFEESSLSTILDNNIQEDQADWLESKDSDIKVASLFESTNANEQKTLVSNIYGASTPQIASIGDFVVYGYVDETGTRGVYDQTIAKYVVYDKTTGTSTNELTIYDDMSADYEMQFVSDGEELYAVYCDADSVFGDEEPEYTDYAKSFKITVAQFDKDTKKFEKLGSYFCDDNYCYNPALSITEEGFNLAWCENNDNEVLALTQTNQVYTVSCDREGNCIGDIKQIAENQQAITSLTVDKDGNVLYFVDEDNILSTEEQWIKYYVSSTGETMDIETYPTEESNVSKLSYQKLPGSDDMAMLCVLDGTLAYFDSTSNEIKYCDESAYVGNTCNYYVNNNAIYYVSSDYSDDTSHISKLSYNGTQYISGDITGESGKINAFATDGSNFIYSVGIADFGDENDEVFDVNYTLKYIPEVEKNEIELQNIYYDYTDFTNGEEAGVSVSIQNKGTEKFDGFMITVEDGDSNVILEKIVSQALVAGEAIDYDFELTETQELAADEMKISVQGLTYQDEGLQSVTETSSQSVDLSKTELTIEGDVRVDEEDNTYVHLDVINSSAKDTTAVVQLLDDDSVLYTSEISVGANTTEGIDVENLDIADEEKLYTATVETADEEFYTDDNETQIIVFKIKAPSYEEVDEDTYNRLDGEINPPTPSPTPGVQPPVPGNELSDVHFGTWTNTVKTYDGKAINAAVTSDSDANVIVTYYTDVNATNALASAPVNAGTYYARATVNETSKFKSGTSAVVPITINKAKTTIKLVTVYNYSGKAVKMKATTNRKASVSYTFYADKKGKKKIATPKKEGTYYVKAVAKATTNYKAATSKITKITIVKSVAQTITAKNVTKTLKVNNLKKKTVSFKLGAKAKTALSYKKLSGKKQITVDKKGKVTVKKGTKPGTYKVKVKITAAKSSKYKAANKIITVKVVVK